MHGGYMAVTWRLHCTPRSAADAASFELGVAFATACAGSTGTESESTPLHTPLHTSLHTPLHAPLHASLLRLVRALPLATHAAACAMLAGCGDAVKALAKDTEVTLGLGLGLGIGIG